VGIPLPHAGVPCWYERAGSIHHRPCYRPCHSLGISRSLGAASTMLFTLSHRMQPHMPWSLSLTWHFRVLANLPLVGCRGHCGSDRIPWLPLTRLASRGYHQQGFVCSWVCSWLVVRVLGSGVTYTDSPSTSTSAGLSVPKIP